MLGIKIKEKKHVFGAINQEKKKGFWHYGSPTWMFTLFLTSFNHRLGCFHCF